jgi:hypothetical protein
VEALGAEGSRDGGRGGLEAVDRLLRDLAAAVRAREAAGGGEVPA